MNIETLRTGTRYTSPLDPIWDAVAETADEDSMAACSIDYRTGGGTGYLEVEVGGRLYRVEITEIEPVALDLTTEEGRERFLADAEAMREQGYDVKVARG